MKEQEPLESLLESATRLVYATHNLSGDLKIYWSNFLLSYSSTSLSNTQIHQREIRAAANSFRDQGVILAFFKNIHPTDQIWILAALILLITEAEKQSDWVSHRNIEDLSKLLRQALSSSGENGISDRHRELETAYSIHQNRKLILVRGSILLVTCDYVLRWLILAVFNVNDYDKDFLWPINLGIPLVIFLLAYLISRNNRRHNQQLIENILPKWNYRMQHSMTSTQYTILGVYLGSSVFIVSLLIPDNADFFSLLLFLGMTLYYYGLIGSFPIGRLSEGQILQQTKSEPEPDLADADQNDETIVQIETELNANTGRLEAYVLESALFGALSFSGFLQIISTDAVSFRDLSDFSANVFSASHGFIYADWSEFYRYAGLLNNKINLLCLVSIETLICSVFFLAVIASRLRFSDVADRVRTALNLAKAYNAKEEALLGGQSPDKTSARFVLLNQRVREELQLSKSELSRIQPIVRYMQYFRNAGILTFLVVLVSSALFITSILGWTFLMLGFATWLYFNFQSLSTYSNVFLLRFQIWFAQNIKLVLWIAVLPAVTGFSLRVGADLPYGNVLLASTFLLLGLFIFVWLVFLPHFDSKFGDIESQQTEAWRSDRWKILKNIYGLSILLSSIGIVLKILEVPGRDYIVMFGLGSNCLLAFPLGYYLSRPKWLGILSALILGTAAAGLLFQLLHLPGATISVVMSTIASLIFFAVFILRRKSFHYLLLRTMIVFLLAALLYFPVNHVKTFNVLSAMFEHGTKHIERVWTLRDQIKSGGSSREDVLKSIQACNQYINENGARHGYTEIYLVSTEHYLDIIDLFSTTKKYTSADTATLMTIWLAAHQNNKINLLFPDRMYTARFRAEADILVALNRKEEAIVMLRGLLATELPSNVRSNVQKKLIEIDAQ